MGGSEDSVRLGGLEARMGTMEQRLETLHKEQHKQRETVERLIARDSATQVSGVVQARFEERIERALDHIDEELVSVREAMSSARGTLMALRWFIPVVVTLLLALGGSVVNHLSVDRIQTADDVRGLKP